MNFKVICRNVGKALLVNAFFMFLSILVSVLNGYDEGFTPLLISFMIVLIMGFFPFIFISEVPETKLKEGFVIIILSWIFSFFLGMLPYILYGGEFTIINAWFESVSGYTTTGSTILTDIEALPDSILFWRSSTHFIGGLGVVVFLLLILPGTSPFKLRLSNLEISSMSRTGYKYKAGTTIKAMLTVYLGLAFVETLLLWAAGMSLFDAVNHAFSTVATGGFSTRNTSVMYFDSPLIDVIITVFMVLSSMHLGIIFTVFAKRSLKPLKSSVTRYYLASAAVLSIALMLVLKFQGGYDSWGKALLDSSFQMASFISTTGFGQADNAAWPFLANLLLLYAGFHCGCSGSTTGGIKADRMFIAYKEINNEFLRRLHPSSMFRTRIDGTVVKSDMLSSVFMYIVAYVFVMMLSFMLVLMAGVDVDIAFSGTLSSLGNVGPGTGSLGTMGNYAHLPSIVKFIFTFDMFFGRVEIFPLLIVISMLWNHKRM
jgi:trk system potassium uptake protein TrkH